MLYGKHELQEQNCCARKPAAVKPGRYSGKLRVQPSVPLEAKAGSYCPRTESPSVPVYSFLESQ